MSNSFISKSINLNLPYFNPFPIMGDRLLPLIITFQIFKFEIQKQTTSWLVDPCLIIVVFNFVDILEIYFILLRHV